MKIYMKCSVGIYMSKLMVKHSFDFQYCKTHKMVYSIDSMHLRYGHICYTDFKQCFCVQQRIILELLSQIHIAAHCCKDS